MVDAPVLELSAIHKSYGRVPALAGLELKVGRGEVYGFLGRNGAGKSTALRIVMGITRPDAGTVRLFDAPARPGDTRLRQRIGYVAQEQHFYEWMTPASLGAFVGAFYPRWDAAHYAALVRRFDVPERKTRTLSGGTKVKLALALALAHRPDLLVLDEPTAGLDAVVRREFVEIVRDLTASGEHSTLFSSHLIDEVEQVATRVGIVEQGVMRYQGALLELAARARSMRVPSAGADEASAAVSEHAVRILRRHERGAEQEFTLWSDDPRAFVALDQRLPSASFRVLSLEDSFIALVRTDRDAT